MIGRTYQPPHFAAPAGALNDRVKAFSEYWDKFFIYTRNFLNRVDASPVIAIAAAPTIQPTRVLQPVTGTATIDTIAVPSEFGGLLTLLSVDGFFLTTGGNIRAARTVLIGEAVTLYLNILDDLWYVQ